MFTDVLELIISNMGPFPQFWRTDSGPPPKRQKYWQPWMKMKSIFIIVHRIIKINTEYEKITISGKIDENLITETMCSELVPQLFASTEDMVNIFFAKYAFHLLN